MIYALGERLQATDFTNATESNAIATQLRHSLGDAASNRIFCLLHAHSGHEERDIFVALRPLDPDVVNLQMVAHRDITRRIFGVTKTCDELLGLSDFARRVEVGDRLYAGTNDLFATDLTSDSPEQRGGDDGSHPVGALHRRTAPRDTGDVPGGFHTVDLTEKFGILHAGPSAGRSRGNPRPFVGGRLFEAPPRDGNAYDDARGSGRST